MTALFVVCATVGTTVLVLQFLLALAGLGGDAHDFSGDAGGLDHDFSADGLHPEVAHGQGGTHADSHHHGSPPRSLSIFRALSLRTVVAALAFFGLAGRAAEAADCSAATSLFIAGGAGLAALYAVYFMLDWMRSLRAEGTARIQRAVGKEASVYLHIPGNRQGRGKIQINLQNRTMEYLATTAGAAIPTGAAVVVTEIVGPDTVEVEPARTASRASAASELDKSTPSGANA